MLAICGERGDNVTSGVGARAEGWKVCLQGFSFTTGKKGYIIELYRGTVLLSEPS